MKLKPYIPVARTPEEAATVYLTTEKAVFAETRDRVRDWAVKHYGASWVEAVKAESDMWAIQDWEDEDDPYYIFKCLSKGKYCPLRAALGDPVGLELAAKRVVLGRNSWAHFSMDTRLESIQNNIMNLLIFARLVKLQCAASIADAVDALDSAPARPFQVPVTPDPVVELVQPVAESTVAGAPAVEIVRPRIGQAWEGPLPPIRCDLNKKIRDVRVVTTGESLKGRWPTPELADQSVERWFRLNPTPSTLYFDERDGAVVGFIAGHPYFFGYAGQEPETSAGQYRGFFDSSEMEFIDGKLRDQETGHDVLEGLEDKKSVLSALEEANIPEGALVRITDYGDLVAIDERGAKRVATLSMVGHHLRGLTR